MKADVDALRRTTEELLDAKAREPTPAKFTVATIIEKSGLAALASDSSMDVVGAALDGMAALVVGVDSRTVALAREEAMRHLRAANVVSPAKLLDRYLPPPPRTTTGGDKQGGTILFAEPEPWSEPVATANLLDEITSAVTTYVVLPAGAAPAIALWVLHTHAFDAAQVSPRLAIVSPTKRCGKTTLLKLIGALARRPLPATNLSAAVLYRVVEAHAPSVLVDEADTFLADAEDLRGIVNAGHDRQSAKVVRCTGDDHEARTFAVFAPVAIAAIGRLPDTIMDRSVVVTMRRRAPGEEVARFRRKERAGLVDLLHRCERWAADSTDLLHDAAPQAPEALNDRAQDNWEPLLAIADLAGGEWPTRARSAALILSGERDDEDARTRGELVLGDIHAWFNAHHADRVSSADLLAHLTKIEGRPWAESSNGRPFGASQLGKLLRTFSIKPGTIRLGSTSTPKGYMRADFEDAWARYLPAPAPPTAATAATLPESFTNMVVDEPPRRPLVASTEAPNTSHDSAHVAAVAATAGGTAPLPRFDDPDDDPAEDWPR